MSKLSDLLSSRNPNGWSAREIGRRAERNGFQMSPALAATLMGGSHGKRPTDATLEALASVLPVKVEEMRAALNLPPDPGTPWTPPDESKHLTPDQRAALTQLIKTIVREEGADDGRTPEAEKTPADPAVGRAGVTPIEAGKKYRDPKKLSPPRMSQDYAEAGHLGMFGKPDPEHPIEVKTVPKPTGPTGAKAARRGRKSSEVFDRAMETAGEENQDSGDDEDPSDTS